MTDKTAEIQKYVDDAASFYPDRFELATEKPFLRDWFVTSILKRTNYKFTREEVEPVVQKKFEAAASAKGNAHSA